MSNHTFHGIHGISPNVILKVVVKCSFHLFVDEKPTVNVSRRATYLRTLDIEIVVICNCFSFPHKRNDGIPFGVACAMLQFPYFAMVTKLQHITLTRTRSDERALSSLRSSIHFHVSIVRQVLWCFVTRIINILSKLFRDVTKKFSYSIHQASHSYTERSTMIRFNLDRNFAIQLLWATGSLVTKARLAVVIKGKGILS